MTVSELIIGLQLGEFQRICVKTYSRGVGFIPLFGGYRDNALKYVGNREIVGCDVLNNCLHLKVKFQKDDLL